MDDEKRMRGSWTDDEERALVELRTAGKDWVAVATGLRHRFGRDYTTDACESKWRRIQRNAAASSEEVAPVVVPSPKAAPGPAYDELVLGWNEWLGRKVKEIQVPQAIEKESRRIGVLCDLHCPFERRDVLAAFVANGPYDTIVLAGDLLDFLPVSPFIQERPASMRDEVQHGTWVLEALAQSACTVIVLPGNHGRRILKKLESAHLPADLMDMLHLFEPQFDLFKLMAKGLANVEIMHEGRSVRDGSRVVTSFLVQLGDCILGHPDYSRKVRMQSVAGFREWLVEWKDTLGLSPWRVVGMGHTHQAGMVFALGGAEMWLELGAAVTVEGVAYATRGKIIWKPPVSCYTTLTQYKEGESWHTDFNSVKQTIVT